MLSCKWDIFDILNKLRLAGAQALAINDERIISTSEIRVAGSHIMVNSRQLLPPFVINAIVSPIEEKDFIDGLNDSTKFLNINVEKSDNITIPKIRDEAIRIDMLNPLN